jgi:hypothetical protein
MQDSKFLFVKSSFEMPIQVQAGGGRNTRPKLRKAAPQASSNNNSMSQPRKFDKNYSFGDVELENIIYELCYVTKNKAGLFSTTGQSDYQ